ncbi:MAG TPA: hypothetical protein PK231_05630 [Acidocella sp.]|nr:hypothetical protein [Acidocella sp.]
MNYPNVYLPETEARIFHKMWGELTSLGRLPHGYKVLCPMCLHPKAADELTLEHIIPKRALKHDPAPLKKLHFLNDRAGLTLTCRACNGLKGSHYDKVIEYLFQFPKPSRCQFTDLEILKVRKIIGYLAAFRELGYSYILSKPILETIRCEFLNPQLPTATAGAFFMTGAFERQYPHAYFDGWCDVYADSGIQGVRGAQLHSVFSCHDDLVSDNIQIRARHLTVTLPAGTRGIIVPKKQNSLGNLGLNMSIT